MANLVNITRRQYALNTVVHDSKFRFEEERVSQWSGFADPIWILSLRTTIYWRRFPSNITADPEAFGLFMETVKRLAYLLLMEEQQSPRTVFTLVQRIKRFVCWLLSQAPVVRRFSDVPETLLDKYLSTQRSIRNEELGVGSVQGYVRALERLYHYEIASKTVLRYCRPLVEYPIRLPKDFQAKTEPIPDEDFQRLLVAAVKLVDETGIPTIKRFREFVAQENILEIHSQLANLPDDDFSQRRLGRVKERLEVVLKPRTWDRTLNLSVMTLSSKINVTLGDCTFCLEKHRKLGDAFRNRRYHRGYNYDWDNSDLNTKIRLVQVACFIIIATSTGMRQSELLALKPGCLIERKVRGKRLYWLKSILSKTSPTYGGEPASWLCGELAAKAIAVLEQLHGVVPSIQHTRYRSNIPLPDSLFRTYTWNAVCSWRGPWLDGGVCERRSRCLLRN